MKIIRTLYTAFLSSNVKPHHVNRAGAQGERYPAFAIGNLLKTTRMLPHSFVEEQVRDYRNNDLINLHCNVCFDTKPPNPFLSIAAARKKFTEKTGLKTRPSSSITALPSDYVKEKMSFINLFEISGEFEIVDEEKFAKAFTDGVGRRFSYGYGLLEVQNS